MIERSESESMTGHSVRKTEERDLSIGLKSGRSKFKVWVVLQAATSWGKR